MAAKINSHRYGTKLLSLSPHVYSVCDSNFCDVLLQQETVSSVNCGDSRLYFCSYVCVRQVRLLVRMLRRMRRPRVSFYDFPFNNAPHVGAVPCRPRFVAPCNAFHPPPLPCDSSSPGLPWPRGTSCPNAIKTSPKVAQNTQSAEFTEITALPHINN